MLSRTDEEVEGLTVAGQVRAGLAPLPARRHAGVLAQRLPRVAVLLHVGVTLDARRPARPRPRRVPGDGAAGDAVDLGALRAGARRPAPAVGRECVAALVLGLVLAALLGGALGQAGVEGGSGGCRGGEEQEACEQHIERRLVRRDDAEYGTGIVLNKREKIQRLNALLYHTVHRGTAWPMALWEGAHTPSASPQESRRRAAYVPAALPVGIGCRRSHLEDLRPMHVNGTVISS